MAWLDDIVKKLPKTEIQVINDAKSPSGKPHVGSLRGILIHDAVYRFLQEKNIPVKYIYGSDDYDPFDALPHDYPKEQYEKLLGVPLCNVPTVAGSEHKDIAMHFISDFFKIFDELNVDAEKYYMRDYYKNGQFNELIDVLLSNVKKIREIYWKVSKSERAENWHPFQVVCENCGKLGTTQVTGYDGKEVTYTCKPDLVTWATGCGHSGKMSPFDGNGKLPYKVEWPAKWKLFGITIEGAGTDHNTRGGSRDVANAISRQILNYQPPVNIPYGFFMLGKAKMSSSKGVGASARDMTNFLPPEILRYLMLTTQPKRVVNFEPTERYVTKLFNDFDKLHKKVSNNKDGVQDFERMTYNISQVFTKEQYWTADFPLITTILQLPHIDIYEKAEQTKGSKLTEIETENLNLRINSAKYWLENYATEEEKIIIQDKLPARASELNPTQKAFLQNYAKLISKTNWSEDELQQAIFNAARITPIPVKLSFQAIYRVLLDSDKGPKAGNLIAYMDKDFIINRLNELDFDKNEFWQQTAISQADYDKWLSQNKDKLVETKENKLSENINEFIVSLNDGKTYMKRVLK